MQVNKPALQRLRKIRQLGFACFAFPEATHRRYDHTLRSLELMCAVLSGRKDVDSDKKRHLITAVLLQDIGQAPFSNSLNAAFPKLSTSNFSITPIDIARAEEVVKWMDASDDVFKKHHINLCCILPLMSGNPPWPDMHWIKTLLNSELDIDRLVYLSQDSAATGIKIPNITEVIKNLALDYNGGNVTINSNSSSSAAQFIFSRGDLYTSVYLHPIKLAVEHLVSEFLELFWDLKDEFNIELKSRKPKTVEGFLKWTDSTVIQSISKQNKIQSNPVLDSICNGLISGMLQVAELEDYHGQLKDFVIINHRLKEVEKQFDQNIFVRLLYSEKLPSFKFYLESSVLVKHNHAYIPLEQSCRDLQSQDATRPLRHRPLIVFHSRTLVNVQQTLEKVGLKLGNISRIKSINEGIIS